MQTRESEHFTTRRTQAIKLAARNIVLVSDTHLTLQWGCGDGDRLGMARVELYLREHEGDLLRLAKVREELVELE